MSNIKHRKLLISHYKSLMQKLQPIFEDLLAYHFEKNMRNAIPNFLSRREEMPTHSEFLIRFLGL